MQDVEGVPVDQSVGQLLDEQGLLAKLLWNGHVALSLRRDAGRAQGSTPQLLDEMSMRSRANESAKRFWSKEFIALKNAPLLANPAAWDAADVPVIAWIALESAKIGHPASLAPGAIPVEQNPSALPSAIAAHAVP